MKILTIILAILSLTRGEPPVPNEYLISTQYLPTQTRNQYLPPQNKYLPPLTVTASKYLPPSTSYGTPVQTQPTLKYGLPTTPNTSYGQPSITYGATSKTYGVSDRAYISPSTSYGDPKAVQTTVQLPSYDVAKSGYSDQLESANYEFEYHVQDAQSGNDFGHREQRQGNVAQGKYFVLLPDGRLQTVEYIADENGYKPKISYQQVGGGYSLSGYPAAKTEGYQY